MKKGRYRGLFFSINGKKIEFHPHDLINDKRERSSHKCLSIDMYYLHHACVSRHEEREESRVFPPSMDDPHANGLKLMHSHKMYRTPAEGAFYHPCLQH